MSFCNEYLEQEQPAQSDFCSLDFCEDLGFPGCEVSVDTQSNYQLDAVDMSPADLREDTTHSRSQTFDLKGLTKPNLEVLDEIDRPVIRLSEERLRSKDIRQVDNQAARVLDLEQEGDFTNFSFGSRGSTLYSLDPSCAHDWNTDYGGHDVAKRCQMKSKVSAYEDLCRFYEECNTPSELNTVLTSDEDHPLDIAWLSDRCDGDIHLLVAVLETFCEQGGTHCSEIRSAVMRGDMHKLCFHTVSKYVLISGMAPPLTVLASPGLPRRLRAQRGRAGARAPRRGPRELPQIARGSCARHAWGRSGAGRRCGARGGGAACGCARGRGGVRLRGGGGLLEGAPEDVVKVKSN
jgi:hypothetical protein